MPMLKISRWEQFAQLVARGEMTDTEAHEQAGYTRNRRNAARLKAKPEVKARIAELTRPAVEEAEVTVDRVVKELCRLAFYDPTAVLEEIEGNVVIVRDPRKLPADIRHAIVEFRPVELKGEIYYRVKLASKEKALNDLARYLKMFKDTLIVENVFRVVREMGDDELDRRLGELERAVSEAPKAPPVAGEGPATVH